MFALALAAVSAPAQAQALRYFYCYAVDVKTQKTFVSDVHDVGPVAERASYGAQFAAYLKAKGYASKDVQPYCVMRASETEIARGLRDLPNSCRECAGATNFTSVNWLRQGKSVDALLAGKLITPAPPEAQTPAPPAAPAASTPAPLNEPVKGQGVYIRVRMDMTDVVYAANEKNGDFLTRHQAQIRGGDWRLLTANNTCPGWMAVSYASNGTERSYFASQGAESEGEASRQALEEVEKLKQSAPGNWISGILVAFHNTYEPTSINLAESVLEKGPISTVKGVVRNAVTSGCANPNGRQSAIGVRG